MIGNISFVLLAASPVFQVTKLMQPRRIVFRERHSDGSLTHYVVETELIDPSPPHSVSYHWPEWFGKDQKTEAMMKWLEKMQETMAQIVSNGNKW